MGDFCWAPARETETFLGKFIDENIYSTIYLSWFTWSNHSEGESEGEWRANKEWSDSFTGGNTKETEDHEGVQGGVFPDYFGFIFNTRKLVFSLRKIQEERHFLEIKQLP